VIVWGLFSALALTLVVVPVLYRVVQPALLAAAPPPDQVAALVAEPLPDVAVPEVVKLVEHLHRRADEAEVFELPDALALEFGRVVSVVQAAEMLGLVETPGPLVRLLEPGRRFAEADAVDRRRLWRERLLELRLFRLFRDTLLERPDRTVDRDFVLETIVMRMPREDYEQVFNTLVRWARFGGLFSYDTASQRLSLDAT
jgi:NitT/TauT family transport system ATP-binding protein